MPAYPETKTRYAAIDDAIERDEQGLDLALSPVQLLWNQEPVRLVVFAEREIFDAALRFPRGKAALEITLEADRCLVPLLGCLGE